MYFHFFKQSCFRLYYVHSDSLQFHLFNSWLSWLKAVLPKHCEKVLEIAALPPGVSIEFYLVRPVLPRRLNAIPRSCSWSWCYPANAWGVFLWDVCLGWFLPRFLWISEWGHPFDMAEVRKLFDTYSIDNGNMEIQGLSNCCVSELV